MRDARGRCGLSGQRWPPGVPCSPAGRRGAGSWMLQQRRRGDSERCERSVVAGEGGAAQKPRRRQPGSFCRPGARTRGARGCGEPAPLGLLPAALRGGRVPALEEPRKRSPCAGGSPLSPSPAPSWQARAGPAPSPAPGGALCASLLASAGTGWGGGSFPRRCGKPSGFVRGCLGARKGDEGTSLPARPWHGGKLGWTEPGGSTKGLRKAALQPSPESGAGGPARAVVGSTGGPQAGRSGGAAGRRRVRSLRQRTNAGI